MSEELSGKLIADKYRVGELIREGEAGDLYHARHEVMDRPVVIKVLPQALGVDARWQKRFLDEARAGASISHPNVLQLNDFGTDQKQYCYAVFEHVDGHTLADEIKEHPLEERAGVDLAKSVADALAAAHDKGVVHGELSPKNIFVSNGVPKVYGFGSDPLNVSRDADPRYLAPEQLNKFAAADARSDVYALGVTLYGMLTGELPFEGQTAADILQKQKSGPPPPFSVFRSDLNADVEPIVLSAMATDPERRYQSMKEFAEDLQMVGTRIGSPAAAAAAAGTSRPLWQTAVVVALGVILLAGALIYATRTKQTDVTASLKPDEGSLPVQPIGAATGAQEDALARLPVDMTPEEIAAAQAANASTVLGAPPAAGYTGGPLAGSTAPIPGADTYNPWANGGVPPPGAPAYVPPAGARVSGDVNPNSPFTGEGGGAQIIRKNVLTGECTDFNTGTPVPCPGANDPNARTIAPPKSANANTANPKPTPRATPAAAKPSANTLAPVKPASGAPTKPGGDQPDE